MATYSIIPQHHQSSHKLHPSTPLDLSILLLTHIYNRQYEYFNTLSIFKGIYPNIENYKDLEGILIKMDYSHEFSTRILKTFKKHHVIDSYFIQELENILYDYI